MALREERSLGELFRELTSETRSLLRQEVELVKAEATEKVSFVGARIGELALGGGIALVGGLVLMAAAVTGLAALLDLFMSTELA
ncbi:MAG TPA: phage holin family protein, partial [Vicinamibacteria bacterium]|nr:phage holin family protein [Vicinamibacteria bacterium]